MSIRGIQRPFNRIWGRRFVLLIALSFLFLLNGSPVFAAEKESVDTKTIYNSKGVEIKASSVEGGLDIEIVNDTTADLSQVSLKNQAIGQLADYTADTAIPVIAPQSSAKLAVRYDLPGAHDQNPNTPTTSFRILPRTGAVAAGILVGLGLLFISALLIGVKKKRRLALRNLSISCFLCATVLLSSVVFPQLSRVRAEPVGEKMEQVIEETFELNHKTYTYKGLLTFIQESIVTVVEEKSGQVAFGVDVVYDDQLPVVDENGEEKHHVRTPGQMGEQLTTMRVTYVNGQPVKQIVEAVRVVKAPVNEVHVYGAKSVSQDTELPYDVRYVADATRRVGTSNQILEKGQNGVKTLTYERDPRSGQLVVKETQVAPKQEIVQIGTQQVETIELPYQTQWQGDPTLDIGQKVVQHPGKNGLAEKITYYDVDAKTGALIHSQSNEKQIKAPETEMISQGLKYTVVTTLPFNQLVQETDQLWFGESRVQTSGQAGRLTQTYTGTLDSATGEVVQNPKQDTLVDEVRTPAVDEVVLQGTKQPNWQRQTTTTEMPYRTIYVPSEDLPFGEKQIKTQGHPGQIKKTVEVPLDDQGQPVDPTLFVARDVETQRTAPIDEIIEVGVLRTQNVSFAAMPTYIDDPTQWRGHIEVVVPGVDGEKTVTTRYALDTKTGNILNPIRTQEVINQAPTPAQIKRGSDGYILAGQENQFVQALKKAVTDAHPQADVDGGESKPNTPDSRQSLPAWSIDESLNLQVKDLLYQDVVTDSTAYPLNASEETDEMLVFRAKLQLEKEADQHHDRIEKWRESLQQQWFKVPTLRQLMTSDKAYKIGVGLFQKDDTVYARFVVRLIDSDDHPTGSETQR